ncbi:MAG: hypothetical protein DRN08_00260 [Thermoplasmata archaeon]|nr:MAG: hypothetical protein DRN05_00535 [Thermoplasmata archaeon]RLF37043.1 MAG: hypothetical protein DRN08_00260 [Thermoplasmata archaeon]
MDRRRLIAGILVFGSIWGFAESIIGSYLNNAGLPSGAIMTGFFAVGLMSISRILYRVRGMQLGMGFIAGSLRLLNPFVACSICSALAIMAEGIIFELIWHSMSFDLREFRTPTINISMGIVTAYCCFTGGFIVTQILTPLTSSAGFYLSNLLAFIPTILSRGLLAAFIGIIVFPLTTLLRDIDVLRIRDRFYYAVTATVTMLCWSIVIVNTLLFVGV